MQSVVLSACVEVPQLLVAVEGPVWKLAAVRDVTDAASVLFRCLVPSVSLVKINKMPSTLFALFSTCGSRHSKVASGSCGREAVA